MNEETDAFELSDEDFDKVMSGESDEFSITAEEEVEIEDTDSQQDEDEGSGGDDLSDLFDLDDSSENASDSSEESQDESADTAGRGDDETIELIHQGKLVTVTKAEAINLAQQGYDYLEKTTRIAPHRRLLDLIDADEELKNKINQHIASKVTPEVTKREDYDSEDEWLQDNMTNAIASANPTLTDSAPAQPTGQEEAPIVAALRTRDPENFNKVGPVLKQAIERLTVGQYAQITSDPQKVVQFYDKVKQHVLTGHTINPSQSQTAPKKKTFNLRSGQGPSKSRTPAKKNVWDLGNKEFNSVLRKVKGF